MRQSDILLKRVGVNVYDLDHLEHCNEQRDRARMPILNSFALDDNETLIVKNILAEKYSRDEEDSLLDLIGIRHGIDYVRVLYDEDEQHKLVRVGIVISYHEECYRMIEM